MRKNWPLIPIFLLGLFLRLFFLGSYPAGFAADEAAQGYAAFSLLKTGADEWGVSWPVTSFRSFADFKAPLQTYLIIPSVALFGLNEFATRLPSALIGTLAILVTYFLSQEIFSFLPSSAKGRDHISGGGVNLGHLAAFLLAISPWHLQFSRTALEANLLSLFIPLGIYLFLKGLEKPKLLSLSALSFVLALYSYHSVKVFLPFFLISLLYVYRKSISLKTIHFFLIPFILVLPLLYASFFGSALKRGGELLVTNLSLRQLKIVSDTQYYSPLNRVSTAISHVFTNKATFALDQFAQNYLSYLSPIFWFSQGGNEISYHVIPDTGLLYLWQFPFILLALFNLLKNKNKLSLLIFAWILLAALPAALTRDINRPNRASAYATLWEMLTALGLWLFVRAHHDAPLRLGLSLIILLSCIWYAHDYFIASPINYPSTLNYGYKQVVQKVSVLESQYDEVLVDRGDESQIFFAFYQKMDPRFYQGASTDWWDRFQKTNFLYTDMLDNYSLGQLRFKTILTSDLNLPNTLIVLKKNTQIEELKYKPLIIDTIYYPNGEPAFYFLSTKQILAKHE